MFCEHFLRCELGVKRYRRVIWAWKRKQHKEIARNQVGRRPGEYRQNVCGTSTVSAWRSFGLEPGGPGRANTRRWFREWGDCGRTDRDGGTESGRRRRGF